MDNEDLSVDAVQNDAPQEPVVTEKKFTQDELNSIVGSRAREAAEKARREVEAQYEQKLNSSRQNHSAQNSQQSQDSNFNPANFEGQIESYLHKKEEERQQKAFNDYINQVATEFTGKVNAPELKEKYSDYDSVISSKKMDRYPNIVLMANELPNTADVYYHLLKHPEQLVTIENTAKFTDPDAAKEMIKKISSSISTNDQSKSSYKKADEPLSRIKPGTVGVDKGELSLSDYKNMFRN